VFLFNKTLSALKIPAFAEGGKVTKPTLALIGEKGPEFVVPEKKLPGLAAMQGLTRNQGNMSIEVFGRIEADGDKMLMVIDRARQKQFRSFGG
jgi:SLT domain-containing protein